MDNIFGAGGGGGGPEQWFLSLPIVTRVWLGSTIIITALANLEFIKWDGLDFERWEDVYGRGSSRSIEAWRLLTCFLYAGKFSWSAFIGLHLMTQISTRYETMGPICTRRIYINPQLAEQDDAQNNNATQQQREERQPNNNNSPYYSRGETPDYIFALLFGMTGILLSQILLFPILPTFITQNQHHRFFQRHLTFYIVYIWSKQHPQRRVNLFGMPIAAAYLPFAYLVMGYALNNGNAIPIDILHGMFVGHVYFYLACIVPTVLGGRRTVISTPMILIDLCNWLGGRGFVDNEDNGGNGGPMLVDVDGVIGG